MTTTQTKATAALSLILVAATGMAAHGCSGDDSEDNGTSTAGSTMAGSQSTGGTSAGGSSSGGSASGGAPSGFRWYNSCGDPVCGPNEPSGTPDNACVDQMLGEPCQAGAESCDPGVGCGVMLVCADQDPTMGPGGCPISRASYKRDITYLDEAALERLSEELQQLRLATYSYIGDPEAKQQLGFILEDVEPSVIADSERDRVNLYAYTSLAVAAIQQQHKLLERQSRQIAQLESQLDRLVAAAQQADACLVPAP